MKKFQELIVKRLLQNSESLENVKHHHIELVVGSVIKKHSKT